MGQSGAEQSGLERAVSGTGHAGGLFQGCEIYMEGDQVLPYWDDDFKVKDANKITF